MNSDKNKTRKDQECTNCHGTEFQINSEGLSCCANCGLIEQQTKFDSNVVFGQQRDLQGKNINKQQKFNQLSSERRLKRAGIKIQDLVKKLAIPSDYQKSIEAAHRLLRYADNCNFFKKGKRIELYAAAALYITLRFNKAPYLLIDFSDKMGIKMFPLARCYLKMSKRFGFQQQLPQIDPSLLIHRYCKMMNLGDKTEAVADSAIKLIKRMKRDWMCQGRRPSSLCGAAILIAAAIHKIKDDSCSTTKICETVFVCDQTIRRRLDEFKHTKFSKIKEQDFKLIPNEESIYGADAEMDPPAFRKARLRSQHEHQIQKQAQIAALESKKKKGGDFDYSEQENIPEEIIQRYSDEIARIYQKASDINQVSIPENLNQESSLESQLQSNNTGGQGELADQEENESDVDEKLIFLDQKMQQQRRKIWQDYHRAWLDKQASKIERGQIETKKKMKQTKKEQQKTDNPFQALIKNPSLGQKVNQGELKRLLASQPKLEQEQTPRVSLTKIFDPFRWSKM